MAGITRKTKRCPSDRTDEEWERVGPLMPPRRGGPVCLDSFMGLISYTRLLLYRHSDGAAVGHLAPG
jgi:hypothetical protein